MKGCCRAFFALNLVADTGSKTPFKNASPSTLTALAGDLLDKSHLPMLLPGFQQIEVYSQFAAQHLCLHSTEEVGKFVARALQSDTIDNWLRTSSSRL